jgi:hypothetical protein
VGHPWPKGNGVRERPSCRRKLGGQRNFEESGPSRDWKVSRLGWEGGFHAATWGIFGWLEWSWKGWGEEVLRAMGDFPWFGAGFECSLPAGLGLFPGRGIPAGWDFAFRRVLAGWDFPMSLVVQIALLPSQVYHS